MQINRDAQKSCTCSPCCFLSLSLLCFCLFIVNFPLIGANFPVFLFLSLGGGLNKLTRAAQLCRNLPLLINICCFFFYITTKFTIFLLLPTKLMFLSFLFSSLMQLMYFYPLHISPPLFGLSWPTFTSFCVCSLSLRSPIPSPLTMHSITVQPPLIYSLAEVLLITVHASVLLSSGATAVQKSYV